MSLDWIKNLVFFAVLLLAQALVLNYVHLFNCATPLLYVYFVLPTRRNQPRWITLVSCFLMGLCVDSFSNTPGVAHHQDKPRRDGCHTSGDSQNSRGHGWRS